ncbi:hypothetical protein B0H21DRAFT_785156 [Amylocystis lapponica]|nr:hypothetical protein B0H21DRAFT_785156 [Amylocystis lapponica]
MMPTPHTSSLPLPPTHPAHRVSSGSTPNDRYVIPPKLPPRPAVPVPDVPDFEEEHTPTPGAFENLPKAEEGLSETQLRELYDDEEIERFLHIFSAYVREVKNANTPRIVHPGQRSEVSNTTPDSVLDTDDEDHIEDDDWVPIHETKDIPSPPPLPPRPVPSRSISERIALDYIVPLLPAQPPPPPAFSLHRLKLTIQRVYISLEPTYKPPILRLIQLATWEDTNTSLVYCTAYWFLWYHNFLLPALVLRILYSLVRRRILPYPSLTELRAHRQEVDRAKDFSSAVTTRIAAAPTFDAQDVWQLFQDLNRARKVKKAARDKAKSTNASEYDLGTPGEEQDEIELTEDPTPEDTPINDVDVKRTAMSALNEIADVHERIKNIFLWRQPTVSIMYGMILIGAFFFTLLPAKYLVKLSGLAVGILFWHAVPIIVKIPPSDRARIPPPFNNVPTDADYAMELISQRVARGLDVKPKRGMFRHDSEDSIPSSSMGSGKQSITVQPVSTKSLGPVNWKKWGERAAATKARTSEVKTMLGDGQWKRPETWLALNPLSPQVALPHGKTESRVQTYTFPAQYSKTSGLITLTTTTFFFTSLLSSNAKLSIPLEDMLGVKKTGTMRGLNISWMETREDGHMEEREEKFLWVGARNDLFVRLIGLGGNRWAKV